MPSRAARVMCAACAKARVPAQEQRRVDMRRTLLIGEPGEAAEHPFVGTQIVAEAASDAQIAIELEV